MNKRVVLSSIVFWFFIVVLMTAVYSLRPVTSFLYLSSSPLGHKFNFFSNSCLSVGKGATRSSSDRWMMMSAASEISLSDDTCTGESPYFQSIRKQLLNCPRVKLRNGIEHPAIGFGTYKVGFVPPSASSAVVASSVSLPSSDKPPRTAEECVLDALQAGYRFLECAEFYGNERQVGNAIVTSGIARSDLFICSKVWTTTIEKGPDAVREQLDRTLADLQIDYIDLYLIHWPVPVYHVAAYKTLIELRDSGKIRGIGVSNYAFEDYMELKNDPDISADNLPLVNQIEINPFLHRKNTILKFQEEGIVLQSYRSLRDGKAMEHPILKQIASKYSSNIEHIGDSDTVATNESKTSAMAHTGKTVAQVLGRWCIQHGYIYVPKSVRRERMIENANVFDFELSVEDMKLLDDTLTTTEALDTFQSLYRKCVNRDTTHDGTLHNVKLNITVD